MDFLHVGLPLGLAIWLGLIALRLHREQFDGWRLASAMSLLAFGTGLARVVASPTPQFYDVAAAAFLLMTLSAWLVWLQQHTHH